MLRLLKSQVRFFAFAASLLGVVIGLAAPTEAAAREVPIKWSLSGTVSPAGLSPTYTLTGAGTGSHLGVFRYEATVVITGLDPSTGAVTADVNETLTAANGDSLANLRRVRGTPIRPGVYELSEQWNVSAGTGRFGAATGSGTGAALLDLNAGTVESANTGSIGY